MKEGGDQTKWITLQCILYLSNVLFLSYVTNVVFLSYVTNVCFISYVTNVFLRHVTNVIFSFTEAGPKEE